MSLLDTLRSRGDKILVLLDDKGPGWLDKVISEGRDKANAGLTKPEDGSTVRVADFALSDDQAEELKKGANEALDVLAANKQPFLRLGKAGFAWILGHWENKDEATARRLYLATQATFDERRTAMHAAGDALMAEKEEREKSWEAVKDVLKKIGAIGLQILIKVIVAAI